MNKDIFTRILIAQVCEQPPLTRELALSERPMESLVERYDELMSLNSWSLGVKVALESIEDELIDRGDMGELNRTKRLDKDLWDRVQAIIQRGANR